MLAYRLTEYIHIYQKVISQDSIGSNIYTDQLIESVYAQVTNKPTRILNDNDRVVFSDEYEFIIRPTSINRNNYIVYEDEIFNIVSINKMIDKTGIIIKAVKNG